MNAKQNATRPNEAGQSFDHLPTPDQKLNELVGGFFTDVETPELIDVINDLFGAWLKMEFRQSTQAYGESASFVTLRLTTFLVQLSEQWQKAKRSECVDV